MEYKSLYCYNEPCLNMTGGTIPYHLTGIAYVAATMADKLQKREQPGLLSDGRQVQSWIKPRQGEFKINSDGALDPATGTGDGLHHSR